MKKLTILAFVGLLVLFFPVTVTAQSAPPPGSTEEVQTLPPGAVTETQEDVQNETSNQQTNSNTDQTQTFITGALAGALGGFVIGAAVAWMAKNKIY